MLLCAPAGVAPGDKDWSNTLKRFATSIGTVTNEAQLPQFTMKIFMGLKRMKVGMLMLNYIALEALKRYRMPMARALVFQL